MADCPLEIPQCKRKIMISTGEFEKRQCPLNVKTRCSLLPPACPLLPQRDDECGLSKIQDPKAPVIMSECPCKIPCILAPPGCPLPAPDIPMDETIASPRDFPDYLPPCSNKSCDQNKKIIKDPYKEKIQRKDGSIGNSNSIQADETQNPFKGTDTVKTDGVRRSSIDSNKCPVSSTRRPLPCAECLLDELSRNSAGGLNANNVKTCPFLIMADICGPLCKCEEVPEVDIGPRCPFLPKPCPCCTIPRCPMSKQPDCPIKKKPLCCGDVPPCVCGKNCLGETVPIPSCAPPSNANPPRCLCGGCPVGSSCPFKAPKCVCGFCTVLFPCCPPKPCSCFCGMCPVGKILCAASCTPKLGSKGEQSCPLISPCCPLNPLHCKPCAPCLPCPPCAPSLPCPPCPSPCPLTQDPCPLLKKPICPPIPPPCSINKYELEPITPSTTFHVPICPEYKPPCKVHLKSSGDSNLICPFSPHPCPLGLTCPFPIVNPNSTKDKIVKANQGKASKKNIERGECPGSAACGVLPHPECPAAEILFPKIYRKKVKPKKEPCPFKKCMRKLECPLNAAMPNIDCPMKESSDCPMSKEPDCPVIALASRCPIATICPALPPIGCPLENSTKMAGSLPNDKINFTECPLSSLPDCLKGAISPKPGCPLLPNIECPIAPKPECPLAPPPACPLAEFAPKSNCPMACPLTPSSNCPLAPPSKCPLTSNAKPNNDKSKSIISPLNKINTNKNNSENNTELDGTKSDKPKVNTLVPEDSSNDCPLFELMPKQSCPLAPPPCPLTPKPKCPLTKKPDPCPLSLNKLNCPVEYPPCKKFPEGRCPMGKLNICDCEYPVSPCFVPLQSGVVASPQYCYKENCCMGLGLPPTEENALSKGGMQSTGGFFYRYRETKPGKEDTKHYVQVMTETPKVTLSLIGAPRKRRHDNWSIVKYGEGFKRCKTIARKLEAMGPIKNKASQYMKEDCLHDPITLQLIEIKKEHAKEVASINVLKRDIGLKNF